MSTHKKIFVNPFHTKKVFANMKRAGKDFSGRITPLFDTMMVQPVEEIGEDSDHPTDSTPIHIIDQPSPSPNPRRNNHLRRLRDRRQRFLKMRQSMKKVLDLQKLKDAQAKEIAALKKRIQRLERRKMSRPTDASKQPDDSTTGEAVTTASVDDSVVPTTIMEITLAQTLIQIINSR
ncbi:hypothetical protein Tco_0787985 [Tanacetum coccineum]